MDSLTAVVVGAGPAGSTVARLLAQQGARVELLEARRLPRHKLCGGGLTPKAQVLVPPTALATVERRVERVELRRGRLPPLVIHDPEASVAMVERDRFDLALAEAAARAGASIRDAEPVRRIVEDDVGTSITTDRRRLRADVVVLADGEPSRLARSVGLGAPARRRSLALEVDLPLAAEVPADLAVLAFDVPGGYAWYFPKGGHANVGIGSYRELQAVRLRTRLQRFGRSLGLDPQAGRLAGHWIPQGLRRGPLASPRIVLAGDTAATADLFFGEGISYAIASGVVAAQTINLFAEGRIADLRTYDRRLRDAIGPALGRLYTLAWAAEASMTLALLGLRFSSLIREAAIDAVAGRRAPFDLGHHCSLICTCGLAGEPGTLGAIAWRGAGSQAAV